MFYLKIADLTVCIQNQYPYLEQLCRGYLIEPCTPDITVSATEEEIRAEQTAEFPMDYLEGLAIYRKITAALLPYRGFLMHGVVISADGHGVSFLARSGVGKTTHATLWRKAFGKRVQMVNGDKPLLRVLDDGICYAYGTPWAGKEHLQNNTKIAMENICFIERGEENSCVPLEKSQILSRLIPQIYLPQSAPELSQTLDLLNLLIEQCRFYLIRCNTDISAATVAYQGVFS